jgi:DNA-binding winged-HTH domains
MTAAVADTRTGRYPCLPALISPAEVGRDAGEFQGNLVTARFGPFTLDTALRQLTRDGAPVHLTPKAFDLLSLLAATAPRVVTKAELHERLWPDTYVSDATLAGLVKELRRSLEDTDAASPIIRTAHRVGYALCVNVEEAQPAQTPAKWHWLVIRNKRVALREGENLVGRDPASQVWLSSSSVSRRHARILISADSVTLTDLGSKNGTKIADTPAVRPMPIKDGDCISFGSVNAVYRASSAGMSTETAGRSGVHSGTGGVNRQESP